MQRLTPTKYSASPALLVIATVVFSGCSADTETVKPASDAGSVSDDAPVHHEPTQDVHAGDAGPEVFTPSVSDWMSQMLAYYSDLDIALVDITLPGSHDTGTYLLSSCTFGATECNTQTQSLTMREQLEAGIRVFDVRPMVFDDQYFTHHTTSCNGLGCQGDTMQSLLTQTREFADAHAELVILNIRHYCGTSATDDALVTMVNDTLGPSLYRENGASDLPFIQRPLRSIIPVDTGKVLVTWDGLKAEPELEAQGRFANGVFPKAGGWSNKQDLDELIADQLARYENFEPDGTKLFEFAWTMTMDVDLATQCLIDDEPRSIQSMADESNGALPGELDALIAQDKIRKGRIPNIIAVDFATAEVTQLCLRLTTLNLE